jgi:hypothetical protein
VALFSSTRERRLWFWTLAVVVAIYATLGLARTVSGALRDRELLDTTFFLAFIVILVSIVALGLKTRPGVAAVGVGLGVAAVYLMVFLRMAIPEERTHLVEYSVVAVLMFEALKERSSNGRHVPRPALLAISVTALVGTLDEVIQAVMPSRVFDPVDIGFNVLAAVMAVTATVVLARVRRRPA